MGIGIGFAIGNRQDKSKSDTGKRLDVTLKRVSTVTLYPRVSTESLVLKSVHKRDVARLSTLSGQEGNISHIFLKCPLFFISQLSRLLDGRLANS